jgi:hypothetical protein
VNKTNEEGPAFKGQHFLVPSSPLDAKILSLPSDGYWWIFFRGGEAATA